jgi:hypothetical protein
MPVLPIRWKTPRDVQKKEKETDVKKEQAGQTTTDRLFCYLSFVILYGVYESLWALLAKGSSKTAGEKKGHAESSYQKAIKICIPFKQKIWRSCLDATIWTYNCPSDLLEACWCHGVLVPCTFHVVSKWRATKSAKKSPPHVKTTNRLPPPPPPIFFSRRPPLAPITSVVEPAMAVFYNRSCR